MKKYQNRKMDDHAVVGIVTAVLIISLIVILLGTVNSVYVPQWMKSAEYQHMNVVSNQFAQLKSNLDVQSVTNASSVIGTVVTMGSIEIPFFSVHQAFDELSILPTSCTLSITNGSGVRWSGSTDSIRFTSHNTKFIDQSYIYEAGALILNQVDENVLLARPSILLTEYGKNLSLSFINISKGTGAKSFVSGHGTYLIYTQVIQNSQQCTLIHNVTNITIQTNYPDAWHDAFAVSLLYSGIGNHINKTSNSVIVDFIDGNDDYYNVFIREIQVTADIAFGVTEAL